mgnify:FL=1
MTFSCRATVDPRVSALDFGALRVFPNRSPRDSRIHPRATAWPPSKPPSVHRSAVYENPSSGPLCYPNFWGELRQIKAPAGCCQECQETFRYEDKSSKAPHSSTLRCTAIRTSWPRFINGRLPCEGLAPRVMFCPFVTYVPLQKNRLSNSNQGFHIFTY